MRFPLRSALLCFGAVLVLYALIYCGIEKSRTTPGAWEVTFFSASPSNAPSPGIRIHHPHLLSNDVTLLFTGESLNPPMSSNVMVRFDQPRNQVPFGTNSFSDLMFLPGVVVLNLFGHEIQLAPRTLVINRQEVPWSQQSQWSLFPSNKLSEAELYPQKKR